MKNLANCTPMEFLSQTVKIKRAVSEWLTLTDIMNIRKRVPAFGVDFTQEQKEAAIIAQSRKNLSAMVDAIAEDHPKETAELLALMCFIEPEDVNNYPMSEYLGALAEMLGNEAVIGFFTSLVRLVQTVSLKG